ncbi:MAG: ABC transporter permease [Clostridia bacterium]|nr:ABC transporter permease [Clostridia bacterium]
MIQSVRMAIKSISGNKMRAFLTMLGIIIGVMALVILVSLVSGATGNVTDTISSLGSDQISVRISDNKGDPVTIDDLSDWMQEEAFGRIAPVASESVTAKYGAKTGSLTVYGTTAFYADVQKLELLVGRFLKQADEENVSFVCIINETAATELVGYADCLGEDIRLNGQRFKVVGVLKDDDNSLTSAFRSGSLVAYIPYAALTRISTSATKEVTSFYVSAGENSTVDAARERLTEILKERFDQDEDAFSVSSQNALESAMSSVTSILAVLLGGIAAISLIVGGIGIMNIMLVTVTERTREIGIRKAIGASRGMILTQFLVEAIVICMLGCALGILGSWGVLRLITTVVSGLDISFQMSGSVVLIAVLFCFFIGIVFGLYPANKAARMAPIDALHYGG